MGAIPAPLQLPTLAAGCDAVPSLAAILALREGSIEGRRLLVWFSRALSARVRDC